MSTSSPCYRNRTLIDFLLSQADYQGELKSIPDWEKAVKICVVIVVELLAIIGNVLVVTIVCRYKKLRTTTNYFLVNLALSDLLVALFPMWMHLVNDLTDGWVMGSFLCKFNPFMQIVVMCSSVFTLIVIAGDRFFAIMFPMKSRVTQRKVSLVLGLVWGGALSVGMPVLFFYRYEERVWKNYRELVCADVWPMIELSPTKCDWGEKSKEAFWTIVVILLNWIPMLFMTVAYAFIIAKLHKNKIVPSLGQLSKSAIQQRSKRKVIRMLFSVLIVFMLCAIPFQVCKFYELYRPKEFQDTAIPEWFYPLNFAAVLLLYANSAINPLIYGGLNESFRQGMKDLVNSAILRRPTSNGSNFESDSSRAIIRGNSLSVIHRQELPNCAAPPLVAGRLSVIAETELPNNSI